MGERGYTKKVTVYTDIKIRCCPGCASTMVYKEDNCWLCKGCKANWKIKRCKDE